jgi:hypothetical protein
LYGYYDPRDWRSAGIQDSILDTYSEVFTQIASVNRIDEDDAKAAKLKQITEGILKDFLTIVDN